MLENIIGNELAMQNNINLSIQLPEDESSLLPPIQTLGQVIHHLKVCCGFLSLTVTKTKSMFILNSNKIKNLIRPL